MAENESLIATPQEPAVAATALPVPGDGDWQVPAQAEAPALETDPQASAAADSVKDGGVKPLGLITPTH
ncbi:hypothetical protein [Kitasatospora mediocidica]|uniref:hypothetical protein n=1 Tax=Kitasatospora mediocidica TaxID=58352 RepID=UPI0005653297|nr:hypothetical protein [Kitasatospora mediocidica]